LAGFLENGRILDLPELEPKCGPTNYTISQSFVGDLLRAQADTVAVEMVSDCSVVYVCTFVYMLVTVFLRPRDAAFYCAETFIFADFCQQL